MVAISSQLIDHIPAIIFFNIMLDSYILYNVDGAMHFIYSHKYTNLVKDSSDMN